MEIAAKNAAEQERLKALSEYQILDTLPEADFDDIARQASGICRTPVSFVCIISANRQRLKSKQGLPAQEIASISAFCAYAANFPGEIFLVNDLVSDRRFKNSPLLQGLAPILFYVGIPLIAPDGSVSGTLSVWNYQPGKLDEAQMKALKALARQLVSQIELRKKLLTLHKNQAELTRAYADLEKFSVIASHDLRSPLNNIISISHLLNIEYGHKLDKEGRDYIQYLEDSAGQLSNLVSGILNYSKSSQMLTEEHEWINVFKLVDELKGLISTPENCTITCHNEHGDIYTSYIALKQILLNLMQNAVKHSDKSQIKIDVVVREDETAFIFDIKDNGPGIAAKDQQRIFDLFQTINNKKKESTGIGLSVVKRLVEKLGGEIKVSSEIGKGSTFTFTIAK